MNTLKMLLACMLTVALFGCGGGDHDKFKLTPTGTPVSLATIKSYLYGTGTTGAQISANLTGSDNSGNAWTGFLQLTVTGPTTISGTSVTGSQTEIRLTQGSSTSTSIQNLYFLSNGNLFQETLSVDGGPVITGTPTSQTQLPNVALVGQSGNLFTLSESDGTTATVTWSLLPDFNGYSKLVITSVSGGDREDITVFLDPFGNPYRFGITAISGTTTVTLAGNKL